MFGCWYDFCKIQWQIVIASSPILFPPLAFASMFTCYLRVTFHIFLNGQITCRLSGPSCPPLVQWHPYPLVPHDLSQPSIPTLQSHMLSFSPTTLPSSPSCPLQPQHPKPPVLHAFLQPYIPVVWSLVTYLSPTSLPSSLTCYPSAQHLYPPAPHALSTTPASLTSSLSCLPSAIHPCCLVTHALPQPSIQPCIP